MSRCFLCLNCGGKCVVASGCNMGSVLFWLVGRTDRVYCWLRTFKFIPDFILDVPANYFDTWINLGVVRPGREVSGSCWLDAWWTTSFLWPCPEENCDPWSWARSVQDRAMSGWCAFVILGRTVVRVGFTSGVLFWKLFTIFMASTVSSPVFYVHLLVQQWVMKCVMHRGAAPMKSCMSWRRFRDHKAQPNQLLAFITKHSNALTDINNILHKYYPILVSNKRLRKAFPEVPSVVYRRNRNFKDK